MLHIKSYNDTSVVNCAAFEWVSNTWDIVFNPWNHPTLMKDSFFINSLVFFMDEQEEVVIKKALEICFLLLQNRCNYEALSSEQYVRDGLSLAFKRYRGSKCDEHQHLYFLCKESLRKLRDVEYEMAVRDWLELRDVQDRHLWGATEIRYHIPGISAANRQAVHRTLASVPGVASVTSCVARRTATVGVRHGFSTGLLRSTVAARLLMHVQTASTAEESAVLQDVSDNDDDHTASDKSKCRFDLPAYYPDVDSPVKTQGTLTTAENIKSKASGIVSWFRDSFYW